MKNDLSSGPAGDDEHTIGDGKILTGLCGLHFETLSEWSSSLLFNKIHCGAVSVEIDMFLTPASSYIEY